MWSYQIFIYPVCSKGLGIMKVCYNNTSRTKVDNGTVQYNTIIILKSNFIQNREYIPYKSLKKA